MHQYICKSVILINIANYCSIAIVLLGVLNIQVIFMSVLSKTGDSDVDATLEIALSTTVSVIVIGAISVCIIIMVS